MIDYFISYFDDIANEYGGSYKFSEEIVGGIGGSSLPLSKHFITVPNSNSEVSIFIYIEFCETALATISTIVKNVNKSREFNLSKNSPFLLLFNKNKKSIVVNSHSESVRISIEALLNETGLERIAKDTLFEPSIKFEESGSDLNIKMTFSMAFDNKEKVIRPIIDFLRRLNDYLTI